MPPAVGPGRAAALAATAAATLATAALATAAAATAAALAAAATLAAFAAAALAAATAAALATATAAALAAAATLAAFAAAATLAAAPCVGGRRVDGDAVRTEVEAERHECRDQRDRAAARKQFRQSFLAWFPLHFMLPLSVPIRARQKPMRAQDQAKRTRDTDTSNTADAR
jgi:hypothetical protein